jgi:hypothetical protein
VIWKVEITTGAPDTILVVDKLRVAPDVPILPSSLTAVVSAPVSTALE